MDARAYHVDPDIRKAETLPPEAFTEPGFLDLELATIFQRSWLLVPQRDAVSLRDDPRSLAEWVRRRGARAPVAVLDRPLFLQRDWKGTLHLFPNVCTHAWHTLVQGPDRDRSVVCPQHGRKFDTEGKFVMQPGFEKAPGFPRDCDHLADLGVAEWGELVFACLGEPAAPFEDVFAPVRASLGKLPFDKLQRKPVAGEVRELDGNWKQHAWNYMDQLHIPYIHSKPGGLSEAVELSTYVTELHGRAALQWAYARNPEHGFDPKLLPARFRSGDRRVFALWWFVFPNLALNFYPWGLSVNVYQPIRGQPQRTLFFWHHYAWDEEKYAAKDDAWMMREVDDEDVDALSQVARGVRSGFAPRGRFGPEVEKGPHWLHRLVYEGAFGARPSSQRRPRGTTRRH